MCISIKNFAKSTQRIVQLFDYSSGVHGSFVKLIASPKWLALEIDIPADIIDETIFHARTEHIILRGACQKSTSLNGKFQATVVTHLTTRRCTETNQHRCDTEICNRKSTLH